MKNERKGKMEEEGGRTYIFGYEIAQALSA
jgi:hypothetical protein